MNSWKYVKSFVVFVFLIGWLAGCQAHSASTGSESNDKKNEDVLTVTIGIQQSIWPILLAKHKGWFEEEFEKAGVKVKWVEFQSGPSYFEAIASNRIDFGRVGNIPVLAGQSGAKVIANGETIGTFSPGFQIIRTQFAKEHPELVELYLKVTEKATRWQLENKEEAIEIYADLKNTDKEVIARVLENSLPANTPISPEIVETQQ
ncbi:hypothetical protein P2R12_08200 [Cytobacillus oceanisediminis]|nr:hypothetical protein [Cytobacillus oceanisediminis]MDF2036955.1 hypothetical protein [Cytobacillus oceanisediminis]